MEQLLKKLLDPLEEKGEKELRRFSKRVQKSLLKEGEKLLPGDMLDAGAALAVNQARLYADGVEVTVKAQPDIDRSRDLAERLGTDAPPESADTAAQNKLLPAGATAGETESPPTESPDFEQLEILPLDNAEGHTVAMRRPEVSEIFQSQPLMEGSQVALSCFIAGYFPQALNVTWLRKESGDSVARPIEDSADYAIIPNEACAQNGETYQQMMTLFFTPSVQRDQGVEFICRVGHLALQTPIERRTKKLEVRAAPATESPDSEQLEVLSLHDAEYRTGVATPDPRKVTPSPREATPVSKEVIPDSREATPVSKEVIPDSREATPVSKEVIPDSREATPVSKEVTPDSRELTPVSKEVTPDSRELTSVSKEVIPDSREATPVSKEVTPDSRELTPVSKEVTPDSRELTPVSKEITSNSREVTPNSREDRGHTAGREEMHFVNQHREQLIQRVTLVEGILDKLLDNVLDNEQYQMIRAEKTDQMKMRKLYEFMASWDRYCKDQLYEALKDKCKYLVADLEGE